MRRIIKKTGDLGDFFKAARHRTKQSIETVAKKSGYTYTTVANLENNKGSTRTETLLAIAEVVEVEVEISFKVKKVL